MDAMTAAAILTAIYDGYDSLKPTVPQSIETDWICVTDDEALGRGDTNPLGWRIVYEPRPDVHPNRAAKRPKMLPADYTDAPGSVWIDASFQVTSPTLAADLLAFADPIANFAHPERRCLFDEANVCVPLTQSWGKYADEPIAEQAERYKRDGMPAQWGLWASGVTARWHNAQTYAWGLHWLAENWRWSYQDQISHPYACWYHDLRPVDLPGTHMNNAWLRYQGSGRH